MPIAVLERKRTSARFAEESSGSRSPAGSPEGGWRARLHWYPRVRLLLLLVVLIPAMSVGLLTGSEASSRQSFERGAKAVLQDTLELQGVTQARVALDKAMVPVIAVTYASHLASLSSGRFPDTNEATLSAMAGTSLAGMLHDGLPGVEDNAVFQSTPALRADLLAFEGAMPGVEFGSASFAQVNTLASKFIADLDGLWYSDFDQLEGDVSAWKPPGSFAVDVTALRQCYTTFITGTDEFEGALLELSGQGNAPVLDDQAGASGMRAEQEVIQSFGEFEISTGHFNSAVASASLQVGPVLQAGPASTAAWNAIQDNAQDQAFQGDVQEAVSVALNGGPAPFLNDPSAARTALTDGLHYLGDLGTLVQVATQDLSSSAGAQESTAAGQLHDEIIFLLALAFLSLSGVLVAGNVVTRPLKKLVAAAQHVRSGNFDLEQLPDIGPREIVATTAVFNDLAYTLRAVEAKTVALATEDLDQPKLLVPLPGRTGQALQAAVNQLIARIREREVQRKIFYEEATHDRLTGLLNRAAVLDYLTNDVSRRRESGEAVGVLFVDLNELRTLNNTYGHEAGDAAIQATGTALHEMSGECDVAGRLGGDEFLVILCDGHSKYANAMAERIRAEVAKRSIMVNDRLVDLGCSVGVAVTACDAGTDPKELVRQADEDMYQAKKLAHAIRDQLAAAATLGSAAHAAKLAAPGAAERAGTAAAGGAAAVPPGPPLMTNQA